MAVDVSDSRLGTGEQEYMPDELDFDSLYAWDIAFERETGYLPDNSPVASARTNARVVQEILMVQQRGMMNMSPLHFMNQQQLGNNPYAAGLGSGLGLGGVLGGLGLGHLLGR